MSEFVILEDVHKTYKMGEVIIPAVNGMSFSIEKGELVVIVGPSGAGKTTVLNILGAWTGPLPARWWWMAMISAGIRTRS